MIMKVFPHGQGNGDGPTHYLTRPDYPGRDRHPPEVFRGDPELAREVIDSLDTKKKFTAGVLSWYPVDQVTPEQETRLLEDFEAVAFAGLEPDQRNILWVSAVLAALERYTREIETLICAVKRHIEQRAEWARLGG